MLQALLSCRTGRKTNTLGYDPKMDIKSVSKLFHCYRGLLLLPVAVFRVEMCQQCYFMKDSSGENFWSVSPADC